MVGGQMVSPGDIVVGDRDGLVVVPLARATELLEAALARDRKEEQMIAEIDRGALTIDLLGLRTTLEKAGLL
jgi:4-hydroxy-4-methyl-2-oxoglutarate aldolase